jgi:hypothetical protein
VDGDISALLRRPYGDLRAESGAGARDEHVLASEPV